MSARGRRPGEVPPEEPEEYLRAITLDPAPEIRPVEPWVSVDGVGTDDAVAGLLLRVKDLGKSLLGGLILSDGKQLVQIRRLVRPDDFWNGFHRAVFLAIESLMARGSAVDLVTLRAELERDGVLEGFDDGCGPARLSLLIDGELHSANAIHYARELAELSGRLRALQIAHETPKLLGNGASPADFQQGLAALIQELRAIERRARPDIIVQPLSSVKAAIPEYDVDVLVRRKGLHLWWGPPGYYKTYLLLLIALSMTQLEPGALLFGIEAFAMRRRWQRVLWLGDEETAGELRARIEIIATSHGLRAPEKDEIVFVDASGGDAMVDVRHIPELVETVSPDAVIVDPLANLLPDTDTDGRPVKVEADNPHALRTVCRPLRRLCKQQDVAVILAHHPGATGERERGPTAYRGSADVVVQIGVKDGKVVLNQVKNRDAARGEVYLEPVWAGGKLDPGRPLALHFAPATGPERSEDTLPDTAKRFLAALRAGGPMPRNQVFNAAPRLSKATHYRNLGILVKEKLVQETPDGRFQVVEKMFPDSH